MKLLVRKQKLNLDKTKTYLLACSGGPDSMALFSMLHEGGYKFDVAFVNYKSRNESDLEQKMVFEYCKAHNIFCHILEKKCSSATNFEMEARHIRYNFFKNVMNDNPKYDALLIAHNGDDLIETYLLQVKRKILPDTYGLKEDLNQYGIKILRPLLKYEKKFLTMYCDKHNVPYSIDVTNSDTKYQRNLIRSSVVSKLTIEEKNKIIKEIDRKNRWIFSLNKKFEANIEGRFATVFSKNIEVLQRFCFYFVKKQGNFMFSQAYKNLIDDIINDRFNQLYKFDKFYIIFDREGLFFFRQDPNKITYSYTNEEFNKIAQCNFEENVLIKPLKEFESIYINGHKKKVNRFFIDCKMPLSLRLIWPCVFVDNFGVIYTPRYRKNYKNKETSKLVFDSKTLQNLNIL